MNVATKSNTSFAGLALDGWRHLKFEYFRAGIDVHWLMIGATDEPTIAVLKYAAGSRVPRHRHVGLETIVVLDGTQSDENGDYPSGTVVLNPPGSEHSVWTAQGCVVLIQWDKPITFIEPDV